MADKLNDMPASEKWSVDGETITLTRSNPNKTVTHSFKLGEDVIEPTMTGDYKVQEYKLFIYRVTCRKIVVFYDRRYLSVYCFVKS